MGSVQLIQLWINRAQKQPTVSKAWSNGLFCNITVVEVFVFAVVAEVRGLLNVQFQETLKDHDPWIIPRMTGHICPAVCGWLEPIHQSNILGKPRGVSWGLRKNLRENKKSWCRRDELWLDLNSSKSNSDSSWYYLFTFFWGLWFEYIFCYHLRPRLDLTQILT